jgi:hypothetical protein
MNFEIEGSIHVKEKHQIIKKSGKKISPHSPVITKLKANERNECTAQKCHLTSISMV